MALRRSTISKLTAALGSLEGAAAADVPKFATGGVSMMMSEVLKAR